jgi:D-alanyl-D-alanine carboxypeptidase
MLNSGNDAAYAIAEGIAVDSQTFTEFMNIKAKELGLTNTYFADPSGLDDDTYSTPEELVKLTIYALQIPTFRTIVKTREYELPSTDTHKYIYLENQTNLLRSYPGVEGVKTGYTEESGLCLITYANNFGHELVGVVLGSVDRKGDMVLMLDHAYAAFGQKIEHHLLDQ